MHYTFKSIYAFPAVLLSLASSAGSASVGRARIYSSEMGAYRHYFKGPLSVKKDSSNAKKDTNKKSNFHPKNMDFVLQPLLGIGTGLMSYVGNVKAPTSYLQNPMTSRIGYDLQYSQKLNQVMEFNLYALFGKLSVNTRSPDLSWNFVSSIEGGGARLLFKLLPKQTITPYIVTGVESFEFLTKTSLYNDQGIPYYYWTDGSIRSRPQGSPMAASATVLQWNYNYSSDMRSLNIGNTGKYQTQTFAIPLGVGFMFHLCKNADFMIGTTLNYTFTNHIDGLGDSIGGRKHDMFLMTSCGLRFDLSRNKKTRVPGVLGNEKEERYGHPDSYYAGVDFDALAQDTVKPDQDNTAKLSDSAILRQYEMYEDSTGEFAQVVVENSIGAPVQNKTVAKPLPTTYSVQLARFNKGVPPEVMDKLMSVPNVKSETLPDSSTAYIVGNYADLGKAQTAAQQFVQNGLPDAKAVYKKDNDYIVAPTSGISKSANNTTPPVSNTPPPANNNTPVPNGGTIVYRVQLGAYKHKLPRDIFMNVDNIVEVKTENGYFTYSAGSFTNYQDAVDYKTKLTSLGYPNLFIKAYQNGKRIPLVKAGATFETPQKEDLNEEVTHETSSLDKSHLSFGVQVGVFKGSPPKDLQKKFNTLTNLYTFKDSTTGLTHYLVGPFTGMDDADAAKGKLTTDPLMKDAFIGAYYNGKPIPMAQALDILKQ